MHTGEKNPSMQCEGVQLVNYIILQYCENLFSRFQIELWCIHMREQGTMFVINC